MVFCKQDKHLHDLRLEMNNIIAPVSEPQRDHRLLPSPVCPTALDRLVSAGVGERPRIYMRMEPYRGRGIQQTIENQGRKWCPGWESNPHEEKSPEDFKSSASAIPPPGQGQFFKVSMRCGEH